VTPNGVVYDQTTGALHVLWRYFDSSYLQSYSLDMGKSAFCRVNRRMVVKGFEGNGLCMSPNGELTGWFTVMDDFLDLDKYEGTNLPQRFLLGRLGILATHGDRFIDVYSDINRDFVYGAQRSVDETGSVYEPGFRLGVHYSNPKPFYLDHRTVALNTPGGFILAVDTVTGQSRVLHDFGEGICDLAFHRDKGLLAVAAESGQLTLLSV
jgi:hypothetical protein